MSANNDEVLSRIDALARQIEAERERNDERYVLRADFEARMDRLTMEVVREVSATLQAMALDAMRTAMQAEFGDLMKKERERERAEREAMLAERDARALAHAAEHPVTEGERKRLIAMLGSPFGNE